AMDSEGEAAAPRFRRIARGSGAAAPAEKRRRQSKRSFETAVSNALAYNDSSDEDAGAGGSSKAAAVAAALSAELAASRSEPAASSSRAQPRRNRGAEAPQQSDAPQPSSGGAEASASASAAQSERCDLRATIEALKNKRSKRQAAEQQDDSLRLEEGTAEGPAGSAGNKLVRKRLLRKTCVQAEDAADKADSDGEEDVARLRARGHRTSQGGPGGKKGGNKATMDSGDEEEPEEDVLSKWQQGLAARQDTGVDDLRTAFSLTPCAAREIRLMSSASFLGGRKPEAGGRLLYDLQGKVNLQFLLGTFRAVETIRQRHANGDVTSDLDAPE
ncbi:unnamed protein product, partial [Polarella glacialis]